LSALSAAKGLTPDQAEAARDLAWHRYISVPHANPKVGLDVYHAELRAIARNTQGDAK